MKIILQSVLLIMITVSCSSSVETIEPNYIQYTDEQDQQDHIDWALKGNGPIYREENIDKMQITKYIKLFENNEIFIIDDYLMKKGVWIKHKNTNQCTALIIENGKTILITFILNSQNNTYKIKS